MYLVYDVVVERGEEEGEEEVQLQKRAKREETKIEEESASHYTKAVPPLTQESPSNPTRIHD